jgi:hypothetical protein
MMENLMHHTNHITLYAITLLAIGLTLRYIVGRRRFNRRGIAGVQYFKSYAVAQITLFIERLTNIIASLMIAGAIILYLIK